VCAPRTHAKLCQRVQLSVDLSRHPLLESGIKGHRPPLNFDRAVILLSDGESQLLSHVLLPLRSPWSPPFPTTPSPLCRSRSTTILQSYSLTCQISTFPAVAPLSHCYIGGIPPHCHPLSLNCARACDVAPHARPRAMAAASWAGHALPWAAPGQAALGIVATSSRPMHCSPRLCVPVSAHWSSGE
jgi:hypothetical protein